MMCGGVGRVVRTSWVWTPVIGLVVFPGSAKSLVWGGGDDSGDQGPEGTVIVEGGGNCSSPRQMRQGNLE